ELGSVSGGSRGDAVVRGGPPRLPQRRWGGVSAPPQRVFAAPPGAKAVAVRGKLLLENRFHDVPDGGLNDPVTHRGYPERTLLLAPQLGYVDPPDRLRAVTALPQRPRQFCHVRCQIVAKGFDRYVIHARSTLV